jgi:hypothetical protein
MWVLERCNRLSIWVQREERLGRRRRGTRIARGGGSASADASPGPSTQGMNDNSQSESDGEYFNVSLVSHSKFRQGVNGHGNRRYSLTVRT